MNRILVAVLALAFAAPAAAQLYKYVDKDGKTVYSDQPPAGQDSKSISVSTGTGSSAKTALDRDKELEKGRKESRDKEKKASEEMQRAQINEERCARAKGALSIIEASGGRMKKTNAQGEVVYLEESEVDAERARARREMDETCKKG